jgi:histidinol dehydrogenase
MKIKVVTVSSVPAEVEALRPPESSSREIAGVVAGLLAGVRTRGDEALVEATRRFDWPEADVTTLAVPTAEIDAAVRELDPALLEALETTRHNCTFFHRHELREDWLGTGDQGQALGIRHLPVERAGLYVPGGLGSYASTVVMNSVPALVAGVRELVICTPAGRDGSVNRSVLAAAGLMGVRRVFRVGGAQAVAAMAYGTETVPRVDVICGPGNAYVMEAKRQVYGSVGIDNLAGPSEVLIVADHTARPEWVAADLLAQDEHGSGASAVLMADSEELCEAVRQAVDSLMAAVEVPGSRTLTEVAAFYPAAGEDFLEAATALVNAYAPEHLEIQIADSRDFVARVRSAGAIFVGHLTPTAFGDYVAGSNHVLPTGGAARFSSPLSVDTFMRRSSLVEMTAAAVSTLTPHLAKLADSEGFTFHKVSAELRAAGLPGGRRAEEPTLPRP